MNTDYYSSVVDIVRARRSSDRPAIVDGDHRLSYSELDTSSNRVAQMLLSLGIGSGDRVGFLGRNCAEFFELLFGAAKLGAVVCAVNWRLSAEEVAYVLGDSGAATVIAHAEFLHAVPAGLQIVVLDGEGNDSYPALRDAAPNLDPNGTPAPDDTWLQLYSSGTTGHPKGVLITYGNLAAFLDAGLDVNHLAPESVSLVALPVFHIGGTGWAMQGLASGATIVLMREMTPAGALRLVGQHRVTHSLWVPTMVQMITVCDEPADVSSIELIMYGAAPISDTTLIEAIERFGNVFVGAYGLTETCGPLVFLAAQDHDPSGPRSHLLRSAGRPALNTELKVVDPATLEELPDGTDGEILIRSPQVMAGYWGLSGATASSMVDDWLRTGDIGNLQDGYLYVNDRLKDMIISGGENVYPAEVENVVAAHPAVLEVAIIGVPHEKWGETPIAFVVLRAGETVTEGEFIAFGRERLAGFKCPTAVVFCDALPRNASGKLLKRELRAPYWEGLTRRV
ncbi:MAG: long-chain-fatty-acid--CoA ligase [Actinobacteria bacterium]|uniref:Unannotated protein n=2 Tax=freshwater metagenome TaxID=449393 RepID=A0A6J7TVH2_9ZZZZ|nr:long-chain-fatty-acid--CoA ligase [Actinomycetota bacterium]MSZ03744.1 long-chain-fatty-acid--CoA ligase [Actinomycetota bacterium]MTB06140.1 long-chain-fatty-acid--CoA ligase [Actinomycetota bacterium]